MTPFAYCGLSFNPFDKQAIREKDRFLSADLKEMTARLDYLKDTRGIGVFTASPGMGKSFALRCFAAGLNPSLYHMARSASASRYIIISQGLTTLKSHSIFHTKSHVPEGRKPSWTAPR